MSEFKGTKGKWEVVKYEKNDFSLCRNEIQFGDDGECVAEFVHNDYDALLISKAPEMLEMLEELISANPMHDGWHEKILKAKQLIKEATQN
jgi:hypothetical protein